MTSPTSRPVPPSPYQGSEDLAVVVGATGAIGSALVRRLLGSGTQVIGIARDAEALTELAQIDGFEACVADVTDSAFSDIVSVAVAGRSVRLAANVARLPEAGGVQQVEPAELAHGVDVKAGGLLRLLRGCDDQLVRGGRLVGFGGRLGYDPEPRAPIASVANGALANVVRQLGRELGPRGVTAHVVAPGPVLTDRLRSSERVVGSARPHLEQRTPLGRLPDPDEIVTATLALLGAAGDLLNGGTLLLDGGQRTSLP